MFVGLLTLNVRPVPGPSKGVGLVPPGLKLGQCCQNVMCFRYSPKFSEILPVLLDDVDRTFFTRDGMYRVVQAETVRVYNYDLPKWYEFYNYDLRSVLIARY